jgi:hypothetical protein
VKQAYLTAAIGTVLLFALLRNHMYGNDILTIHWHETYYALSAGTFYVLVILFIGTLFFTGGTIGTRARNKFFFLPLLLFVGLDIYFIIKLSAGVH